MTFCFPLLQDDLEKGHFLTVLPDVVRSNKVQFSPFHVLNIGYVPVLLFESQMFCFRLV